MIKLFGKIFHRETVAVRYEILFSDFSGFVDKITNFNMPNYT